MSGKDDTPRWSADADSRNPGRTRPGRRERWPGGGTATREDAQGECMDAITFAQEGHPSEYYSETQAIALEVSVAPAA